MKKFYITLLTMFCTLSFTCCYKLSAITTIYAEDNSPVISLSANELEFFDNEDVNLFDYIDVKDESNVEVDLEIEGDVLDVGEHEVLIKATDENGNRSTATMKVIIDSYEEYLAAYIASINAYVKDNSVKSNFQYAKNDALLEEKGPADLDAFELARTFIGMKGSCATVAQAFINAYFGSGYDVLNTYDISAEEAEPGDIVYYTNSGFGQQHYAVYLGGSSALHGNINGTTVVAYVYMNYGSTPQFKRLSDR